MNGTEKPIGNATPPAGYRNQPEASPPGYGGPQDPSTGAMPPPARGRVPMWDPRAKSPVLASILSLMPGLGQVYVGYYQRGFIHALVIAGIIAVLNTDLPGPMYPLLGLFMAFFWLYNVIDAGRRASLYNQVLAGNETIELPSDFKTPSMGGSIAGGVVLLVAGFILLLHTVFDLSLTWMEDWWPVAPMLFGAFLLVKGFREKASERPEPAGDERGED
jgi:hypothetical protein